MTDNAAPVLTLPVIWAGVEEMPVQMVNGFLIQLDQDTQAVFMTVGIVVSPPVVGTPDEQNEQLKHHTYVPATPVARLGMTRARFEELRQVMNNVATTWPPVSNGGSPS